MTEKISLSELLVQKNEKLTRQLELSREETAEKERLLQKEYAEKRVNSRRHNQKVRYLERKADLYENLLKRTSVYCIALSKNDGHIAGTIRAVR